MTEDRIRKPREIPERGITHGTEGPKRRLEWRCLKMGLLEKHFVTFVTACLLWDRLFAGIILFHSNLKKVSLQMRLRNVS